MNLTLLTAAIMPVILLAIYVYVQDKYEKEPFRMLLKAFFFGVLSIVPAVLMEQFLSFFTPPFPILSGIYNGYIVAGCSEELCKLLLLTWAVWKSRDFNEYFDGIVYATYVSLGFACLENIMYVFHAGDYYAALSTSFMRALLSVPGHFLFGVAMGYYYALARFQPERRALNLLKAFLVPMFLHGTFDSILMIPESMGANGTGLGAILFFVFIWFDIKLWKQGRKRLRHLQELSSQQDFESGFDNHDQQPLSGNNLEHLDWNV